MRGTVNVAHATHTLARYKASQLVRERYRRAGRKLTGIKASALQAEADALVALPEVQEWARQAVSQFKTSAPKGNA